MPTLARFHCVVCGSRALQPLAVLAEQGTPHGQTGHNVAYAYKLISTCQRCGGGQLEVYSHDCFHYYADEPWDMYWWYALPAVELGRLRQLLATCRRWLDPRCSCHIHAVLRASTERLWGGVRAATDAYEHAGFAWLVLQDQDGQLQLAVDRTRGLGQAASAGREP